MLHGAWWYRSRHLKLSSDDEDEPQEERCTRSGSGKADSGLPLVGRAKAAAPAGSSMRNGESVFSFDRHTVKWILLPLTDTL